MGDKRVAGGCQGADKGLSRVCHGGVKKGVQGVSGGVQGDGKEFGRGL